jgi:hypothetical protein
MNKNSLTILEDHCFWQQRVNKEIHNEKRYQEKAYQGGFNHKYTTYMKKYPDSTKVYLKPSYPIPFTRCN